MMENYFVNVTNYANNKSQAERFKQIQHKLQIIAQNKNTNQKEQKVNRINIRLSSLQKLSNDQMRKVELQLKEQKEALKQLNRQFEQSQSEHELSQKNRVAEINQLQNKAQKLILLQIKKARQNENRCIIVYQQKMQKLRVQLQAQIQRRKQYFHLMDKELSQRIPCLQNQIAIKMSQLNQKLNKIQKQMQIQTQKLCMQIRDQQSQQLKSFQQLMRMISGVIAEVKQEIAVEKENRQKTKEKLLILFDKAYQKLMS